MELSPVKISPDASCRRHSTRKVPSMSKPSRGPSNTRIAIRLFTATKPANIIIDETTSHASRTLVSPKTRRTQQLAQQGVSIGTPAYMSPEQATADNDRVGPASDIYSLGAVVYSLLGGRWVGPHSDPPTSVQKFILPSDLDPTIDRRLEAICMKCLKKVPRNATPQPRHSQMTWIDVGDQPIEAVPSNPVTKMGYWLRDVPLIAAIIGRSVQSASLGQRLFSFCSDRHFSAYSFYEPKAVLKR